MMMEVKEVIEMIGVTEYCEEMSVYLTKTSGKYKHSVPENDRPGNGRLVVKAYNEAGHNTIEIDIIELIQWLKNNRPDLIA